MNALTVNLRQIADLQIQSVYLKPVLGAYELVFSLRFSVHGVSDGKWSATLEGARVKAVGVSSGELGVARPDAPLRIDTMTTQVSAAADFVLPLSPPQVSLRRWKISERQAI